MPPSTAGPSSGPDPNDITNSGDRIPLVRPRPRPRPIARPLAAPTPALAPTLAPTPGPAPDPAPAPALVPAPTLVPAPAPASPSVLARVPRALTPVVPPLDSAPGVTPTYNDVSQPPPATHNTTPALLVEKTSYNDAFVRDKEAAGPAAAPGSSGGSSITSAPGDAGSSGVQSNVPPPLGTHKKTSGKSKRARAIQAAKEKDYTGR